MGFRQLALPVLIFALLFRLAIHPVQYDVEGLLSTVTASAQPHVLLLTAHPDDECMFFAPTLLGLIARQRQAELRLSESGETDSAAPQVYSLCLSVGDGDGDGAIRAAEFERSLDVLGVKREKRWVLDNPYVLYTSHHIQARISPPMSLSFIDLRALSIPGLYRF